MNGFIFLYGPPGVGKTTIAELLSPFAATAKICGMRYLPPFVVHGCRELDRDRLGEHALRYRHWLSALRDDIEDPRVAGNSANHDQPAAARRQE